MRWSRWVGAAVGFAACEPGPGPAGAPVDLDPSCGGAGRVVLATGVGDSVDLAGAVHRDPDGTTLVVGTVDEPVGGTSIQSAWFASTRLEADCSVDLTYGSGGLGWFAAADPEFQVEALDRVRFGSDGIALYGRSVQPVDGADLSAVTAARFASDGSRDLGFGAPYVHLYRDDAAPYPDEHVVRGVVGTADGGARLLTQTGGPYGTFALVTLGADGFDPPSLYATDGAVDGLPYEAGRVEGLAVLDDGSTLIGGVYVEADGRPPQIPGVLKLGPDGAVDPSFGSGGVAGADTDGDVEGRTFVAVQPDGRILLAGVVDDPDGYQALGVQRFEPDGQVDRTFGAAGVARVALGADAYPGEAVPHGLQAFTLNDDGTMTLGGDFFSLDTPSDLRAGAARLLPDGALDPSFAADGVFDPGALADGAPESLAGLDQAPDGVVTLAVTRSGSAQDSDWVVYRLAPR